MFFRHAPLSSAFRACLGAMTLLIFAFAPTSIARAMTPECKTAAIRAAHPTLAKWFTTVTNHLSRNAQRYTASSKPLPKGRALVKFKINRSGVVESAEILESSGAADVDEHALQYVRAASPFPSPPSDYGERDAEFIVPIAFSETPKFNVSEFLFNKEQCPPDAKGKLPLEIKSTQPDITLSQIDAASLAEQIPACLTATPLERLHLKLRLNSDGSLSEPPSNEDRSEKGRYSATMAISDLLKCKPFKLSADSHHSWREISVIYDPEAHAKLTAAEAKKLLRR
jgi:TonB family protein